MVDHCCITRLICGGDHPTTLHQEPILQRAPGRIVTASGPLPAHGDYALGDPIFTTGGMTSRGMIGSALPLLTLPLPARPLLLNRPKTPEAEAPYPVQELPFGGFGGAGWAAEGRLLGWYRSGTRIITVPLDPPAPSTGGYLHGEQFAVVGLGLYDGMIISAAQIVYQLSADNLNNRWVLWLTRSAHAEGSLQGTELDAIELDQDLPWSDPAFRRQFIDTEWLPSASGGRPVVEPTDPTWAYQLQDVPVRVSSVKVWGDLRRLQLNAPLPAHQPLYPGLPGGNQPLGDRVRLEGLPAVGLERSAIWVRGSVAPGLHTAQIATLRSMQGTAVVWSAARNDAYVAPAQTPIWFPLPLQQPTSWFVNDRDEPVAPLLTDTPITTGFKSSPEGAGHSMYLAFNPAPNLYWVRVHLRLKKGTTTVPISAASYIISRNWVPSSEWVVHPRSVGEGYRVLHPDSFQDVGAGYPIIIGLYAPEPFTLCAAGLQYWAQVPD